jgi:hypothetical protein
MRLEFSTFSTKEKEKKKQKKEKENTAAATATKCQLFSGRVRDIVLNQRYEQ